MSIGNIKILVDAGEKIMQILGAKFIYVKDKENLSEVLRPFKDLAIQLSFFKKQDFLHLDHNLIKNTCDLLNIDIASVHAPTVDVFDSEFFEILAKIRNTYNTDLISIHPQKGKPDAAMAKLKEYAKAIEELDVILAYENFPSSVKKRKWVCSSREMHLLFDLPFLKLTFDTSHLDRAEDCIEEFDAVSDKVAVIHLSDKNGRRQHQPLGQGQLPYKQFISHLDKLHFSGPIVLEYMPEYQARQIEDMQMVERCRQMR